MGRSAHAATSRGSFWPEAPSAVFALRALVLRGRAVQTSATPGKFTALEDFFAQRRLRAAAKLLASPDLPDPVAHLVCKFWLGRPPRRGSGFY